MTKLGSGQTCLHLAPLCVGSATVILNSPVGNGKNLGHLYSLDCCQFPLKVHM